MSGFIDRLFHLLHRWHVLPAVVLASLLFIVEQNHYLDWVDAAMLRVSQRQVATEPADSGSGPVVLGIADPLYETAFHQAAPLDRGVLTRLLADTLAHKPKVLAVDIDLSPGPSSIDGGQQALDALLLGARERYPSTRLILITPLPVSTPKLLTTKSHWMKTLCARGVEFAAPTLLAHQGSVLKYEVGGRLPSLGVVATSGSGDVCGRFARSGEAVALRSLFDDLALGHGQQGVPTRPINFRAFEQITTLPLESESLPPITLAGRTVFIGGAFGQQDFYLTPGGELPGVLIHAAVAYSAQNAVGIVPHALAVGLDVVLGIGFGLLFAATWGRYFHALSEPQTREHAFLWLLLNFLILGVALSGVFHLAGWLLHHALWLNPAPILFGMFIDTLLAKEPHHAGHHVVEQGALARWITRLRWSIAVLLVAWAIFLLLQH